MGWMAHRKWEEIKQHPIMLPGPAVSVKTDFSPAEPPAYYPANPPAGGPPAKNHEIRLLPSIR